MKWWLVPAAMIALLAIPQSGDSCGPFIAEMRFTTYHGLLPNDLESGHYGVVRPHFWRRDLLLAYRGFSGVPFTHSDDVSNPPQASPNRTDVWLAARREVPGAPALDHLDADRKVPGADYEFYANCLDAAFQSAADRLHQHIAKWGAASPQVKDWLAAQDQVFQNCSAGAVIPPPLPASSELAADRAYQIAAAAFYSEQYDRAEAAFDRIAADSKSPWSSIAPYLAARAAIRHATIGGAPEQLDAAAKRLRAIISDPAKKSQRDSAEALLQFVRARTEPQQRLVELGGELTKSSLGPQLGRILTDYTRIWDTLEAAHQQPPVSNSDVAAWIAGFQHREPGAPAPSAGADTLPWLLDRLVWLPLTDSAAASIIRQAHNVTPDSPAYGSVAYYGILRQIRAGELDPARQWADAALANAKSPAALNLIRAERLRLARNWTEFLQFATRKPVGQSVFDNDEEPLDENAARINPAAFDSDATDSLNEVTPLDLWIQAARDASLPAKLRIQIAQAGWTRAILLEQPDSARTLAGQLAAAKPELRGDLQAYIAEKDPAAARFTAIFLMLRAPGFEPILRPGFGRQDKVTERDLLRDNWWEVKPAAASPSAAEPNPHQAFNDLYPDGKYIPPDFLPKTDRERGSAEWAQILDQAGNGVNYLCSQTLDWARSHPRDSRVPQALHLCVNATHYGPADKESSAFSKQAFDLLHRRYPDSEWTRQTKYWY